MATTTTIGDLPQHIIQTQILPRLDGRSLSTVATVSSSLHALCSDQHLWAQITNSTWPSITHPHVDDVIATFSAGHRSFFQDSFPSLITDFNHRNRRRSSWPTSKPDRNSSSSCINPDRSSYDWPSELISAVDIRFKNDVVYSTVQFTETTTEFLSSPLRIELSEDPTRSGSGSGISRSIDLEVDELAGADTATLSELKESVTLNWILIDPTRKRAGNLSSIKAVSARQDWMSSETILQYVVVLPGCESNEEMVKCKIQVVLEVGGMGLHVKKVVLKCEDLDANCVNGEDFLVISEAALNEENNVSRKVVDDEDRWKSHKEFKKMRREKREWVKKQEEKREFAIKINYIGILVSFCLSLYFLVLICRKSESCNGIVKSSLLYV